MYIDKHHAEKSRAARGYASMHEWHEANKTAQKGFRSRMHRKGEDRDRCQRLIDALESERLKLIAPFL